MNKKSDRIEEAIGDTLIVMLSRGSKLAEKDKLAIRAEYREWIEGNEINDYILLFDDSYLDQT